MSNSPKNQEQLTKLNPVEVDKTSSVYIEVNDEGYVSPFPTNTVAVVEKIVDGQTIQGTVSKSTFITVVSILGTIATIFAILFIVFLTRSNGYNNTINGSALNNGGITTNTPTISPVIAPTISPTVPPTSSEPTSELTSEPTSEPTPTPTLCTSQECINLANEIMQSINFDVDPCDDFSEYACGNWRENNEYNLYDFFRYGNLAQTPAQVFEQIIFDETFYYTDPDFSSQSSVQTLKEFLTQCYSDKDPLQSRHDDALILNLLNQVTFDYNTYNFSDPDDWSQTMESYFEDALTWALQRDFTSLFKLLVYDVKTPEFIQDWWTWSVTFQIQSYFDIWYNNYVTHVRPYLISTGVYTTEQMNEVHSDLLGSGGFISQLVSINTATHGEFYQTDTDNLRLFANFSDINDIFDEFNSTDMDIINYEELIIKSFENIIPDTVAYYNMDPDFFKAFNNLIANTAPQTVQAYIYIDTIMKFVSQSSSDFTQSLTRSRRDHCLNVMKKEFPFLFGYILHRFTKTDEDYTVMADMIDNVKANIRAKFYTAQWLYNDTESLNNAIKKIDNMGVYIGIPLNMRDIDMINKYYANYTMDTSFSFTQNYINLIDFDKHRRFNEYTGYAPDLFEGWPSEFRDESSFNIWLTNVNAFYRPSANYFCITNTISVKPFFNSDNDMPISLNYGGLGSVIGHEIVHGFDPSGSNYNYNGTLDPIYSNNTLENYNELITCLENQYTNIDVPVNITVLGNITIKENAADNGGVSASYAAYIEDTITNGFKNDIILPGLTLTDNQLFWYAWARVWCSVSRPTFYQDWNNVHAPDNQRINGVVMNSDEFAKAFKCPSGSNMNPVNKCIII